MKSVNAGIYFSTETSTQTEQYENWQITKEFIISLLCSNLNDASLDKASKFWLAFYTKARYVC